MAQPIRQITEDDYLRTERAGQVKHEYYAGRVYAMAGASEAHNLIVGNLVASLHGQLRGRSCRVYPSDMRLNILATGLYTYPDITVVCGQSVFMDAPRDTLTNPTVLIQVLSPSTERYDRGTKFQHYRMLPLLQEYILIAQDVAHIEQYTRQSTDQWLFSEATTIESHITLQSIDCTLILADVYENVDLLPDTLLHFPDSDG